MTTKPLKTVMGLLAGIAIGGAVLAGPSNARAVDAETRQASPYAADIRNPVVFERGSPPRGDVTAALQATMSGVSLGLGTEKVTAAAHYISGLGQLTPTDGTVAAETFAARCAGCHGANAEGNVGPPVAGSSLSAEEFRTVVAGGRDGMPAFGSELTDADIEGLRSYLVELADGTTVGTNAAETVAAASDAASSPGGRVLALILFALLVLGGIVITRLGRRRAT